MTLNEHIRNPYTKNKKTLLYAVSLFVAKRQKFINPRKLIFSAVDEFIGWLILDNADSIV